MYDNTDLRLELTSTQLLLMDKEFGKYLLIYDWSLAKDEDAAWEALRRMLNAVVAQGYRITIG